MSAENVNLTGQKLLIVGRAWNNTRDAGNPNMPAVTLRMDQNLGINLTIGAGTQILLFKNPKREGVNPNTGENFQDPDFNVSIAVPADVAAREIARQRGEVVAAPAADAPIDPTVA